MPIRTQCPSCQTALGAPDSPTTQRVRCPFCGHVFTVEPKPAAVPRAAPAARPRVEEATRPADDFDIAAARRAPMPTAKRDAAVRTERPVAVRTSSHLPVGLLVGLGVGVFGLFILMVGGGLLIWLASSSNPSKASTNSEVAQAKSSETGQATPFAAGPRAVPDAPADLGDEEFVDLPERGEAIPGVAGRNPDPPLGEAGAPAGAPRVVLTGGRAQQMSRQAGLFFHVNYRFEQGAPVATMRYGWVIFTARGRAFIQRLAPGTLVQQGSLEGQIQTNRAEAPFRTFLIAEMAVSGRPGLQQVKISDEMTFR